MWQKLILMALKDLLLKDETKVAIFRSIDKAVKDTKNPIDDKAGAVVKSVYDVIIGVL